MAGSMTMPFEGRTAAVTQLAETARLVRDAR
jgi:hypothetical protein